MQVYRSFAAFLMLQLLVGSQSSYATDQPAVKMVVKTDQSMKAKIGSYDGLINADFHEPTDIRDIARAFSLWLDAPFEVEDGLQAKVKLNSPERVTKQEALKRFPLCQGSCRIESQKINRSLGVISPGLSHDALIAIFATSLAAKICTSNAKDFEKVDRKIMMLVENSCPLRIGWRA